MKDAPMSVAVSEVVFEEVQQKVAERQAAINLIQNQLTVAQQAFTEWQSILADLYVITPAQ